MMVFPGSQGVDVALLDEAATRLGAEQLSIQTEDGETLYGWHRASPVEGPRRVVLYFHGNASSVLAQIDVQDRLLADGWDFVGIHYRGYAGSTGVASEAGVRRDALAAWKYVREELETPPERIAIHGRSLGGGVAVQLAANVQPAALVLESTFTSLLEVAKERFGFIAQPGLLQHPFMSKDFAAEVKCPVLVLHGSGDHTIDVSHGRALAKIFEAEEYVEIPGNDHNDPLLVGPTLDTYMRFLDSAAPKAQP